MLSILNDNCQFIREREREKVHCYTTVAYSSTLCTHSVVSRSHSVLYGIILWSGSTEFYMIYMCQIFIGYSYNIIIIIVL